MSPHFIKNEIEMRVVCVNRFFLFLLLFSLSLGIFFWWKIFRFDKINGLRCLVVVFLMKIHL